MYRRIAKSLKSRRFITSHLEAIYNRIKAFVIDDRR
jgi:hypothetical protein